MAHAFDQRPLDYFRADDLVTDRIGLEDIVAKGFERLLAEKSQIKIMVTP